MHIIQEDIGLPIFSTQAGPKGEHRTTFTIAPLPPGWGLTLGNGLRRALLSSLPGAAATAVRISGVQHEYTTVKGVRESVVDLVLNLKQLRFRKHGKDNEIVKLNVKGPSVVTAKDLEISSDLELLNPDLVLCNIEKGGSLELEITVEKGVGYEPSSERNKKHHEPGLIHIDAVFSPVTKVRYDVQPSRVGQRTNLEKLIIDVETNGSLSPEEAVQFASQLLTSYFQYFANPQKTIEPEFMADFSRTGSVMTEEVSSGGAPVKESYTPIEILNLSPRTLNALINAGVGSIEQLTKCTEAMLANFRGFGAKALDEVKGTLATRGLTLTNESDE